MAPTTPATNKSAKVEKSVRKTAKDPSTEVVSKAAAAKKTVAVGAAVAAAAVAAAPSSSSSDVVAAAAPALKETASTKLLNLLEDLSANRAKIDAATAALNDLRREDRKIFAAIGKQTPYVKKIEAKNTEKSIKRRANSQPNGLANPALASDAMNAFLGNAPGTKVSRVAAAKTIVQYCKDNLKVGSTNGHRVLDAKTAKLWPSLKEIQLFKLQVHIKDHFHAAKKSSDKDAAAAKN